MQDGAGRRGQIRSIKVEVSGEGRPAARKVFGEAGVPGGYVAVFPARGRSFWRQGEVCGEVSSDGGDAARLEVGEKGLRKREETEEDNRHVILQ